MPSTNAPRNIATTAGNISLEREIVDSQHRARQIPLVDVRLHTKLSKPCCRHTIFDWAKAGLNLGKNDKIVLILN
jgi:hypothetical protein